MDSTCGGCRDLTVLQYHLLGPTRGGRAGLLLGNPGTDGMMALTPKVGTRGGFPLRLYARLGGLPTRRGPPHLDAFYDSAVACHLLTSGDELPPFPATRFLLRFPDHHCGAQRVARSH